MPGDPRHWREAPRGGEGAWRLGRGRQPALSSRVARPRPSRGAPPGSPAWGGRAQRCERRSKRIRILNKAKIGNRQIVQGRLRKAGIQSRP